MPAWRNFGRFKKLKMTPNAPERGNGPCPFPIGSRVRCINNFALSGEDEIELNLGEVYVVRLVGVFAQETIRVSALDGRELRQNFRYTRFEAAI